MGKENTKIKWRMCLQSWEVEGQHASQGIFCLWSMNLMNVTVSLVIKHNKIMKIQGGKVPLAAMLKFPRGVLDT